MSLRLIRVTVKTRKTRKTRASTSRNVIFRVNVPVPKAHVPAITSTSPKGRSVTTGRSPSLQSQTDDSDTEASSSSSTVSRREPNPVRLLKSISRSMLDPFYRPAADLSVLDSHLLHNCLWPVSDTHMTTLTLTQISQGYPTRSSVPLQVHSQRQSRAAHMKGWPQMKSSSCGVSSPWRVRALAFNLLTPRDGCRSFHAEIMSTT